MWPTPRPARTRTYLIGVAAVLLVTCACSRGSTSAVPPAPGAAVGQKLDKAVPATIRRAALTSSDGLQTDLAALTGKVVVVSDAMTLCQETCPLDTANVVAAARAVEKAGLGADVEFLSITVDPQRDTPPRLAAYRNLYSPAPADWLALTGSAATLDALWKDLGVYIQKVPDTPPAPTDWLTGAPLTYDITHSDEVFFFDRTGTERFLLEGAPHVAPGAPVPNTLRRFLSDTGRDKLAHPESTAWTLTQEMQVLAWLVGRDLPPSG